MRVTVSVMIAGLITAGCTSTIPVHVDEPMNNDRVFNYDQVNNPFSLWHGRFEKAA